MGLDGILLVDKAQGWTSHDVVAKARRITGQRKIGHTGTLDPMATGLLVLCLGQATRLVEYMVGHDKRYQGEIRLGIATDTDDAEGEVVSEQPAPSLSRAEFDNLARRFTGKIMQRPPAYSAVKVAGRRAYAVARGGGTPDVQPRPVVVHSLSLEPIAPDRLSIRVHCGPGTYIRSIARDVGEAIGCGAHLAALRRTQVGRFDVAGALVLEDLARLADEGVLGGVVQAADEGIADRDAAIVGAERAERLHRGIVLEPATAPVREARVARIYSSDGAFVGVGEVAGTGQIRPVKVFQEG